MKATDPIAWISYHIYHSSQPDELLTNTIWPFVEGLISEHLIHKFFFIRYNDEHGPHVRLRLLPNETANRQKIMRRTKARLPNARFVMYTSETMRYGGPDGVLIAEEFFEASSLAVLRIMASDRSWSYSRALASAMQMHIGMLQAFGLTRREMVALCEHILQSAITKPAVKDLERNFAAQRRIVSPQLSHVWNACEQQADFAESWFVDWREAMRKVGVQIRQADKAGKLSLTDSPQHESPLWSLYESYIHMSNNRLGVARLDEVYLAFVLHQSLKLQ